MKKILIAFPILCLPFALPAQDEEEPKQPSAAGLVLSHLKADKVPAKPTAWTSPEGSIVLHGDLFGDGRHLALAASDGATFAKAESGTWKILDRWDVLPAWVPAGKKPEDLGYYHIDPPEVPFILRDLTGDKVPEILVSFNNDGYRLGYRIFIRKDEGVKLLDTFSQRGEPEVKAGLMVLRDVDWGRKSWGSIDTCYRWVDDAPVAVAYFGGYGKDEDDSYQIVAKVRSGGGHQSYKIIQENGTYRIQKGTWDGAYEFAELKDFAKVTLHTDDADDAISYDDALLFEKLTGVSGEVCVSADQLDSFKTKRATARWEIEGSEEAKTLLGEKP